MTENLIALEARLDKPREAAEPLEPVAPTDAVPFFPYLILSQATAVFVVLTVISILTIFAPIHLDIKANPMVTPEGSKPEWYFLFLYSFLHYVPPLIGVVAPLVGIGLLFAMPWLDRNPERAPNQRVFALAGCVAVSVLIVVFTVIGYLE